MEMLHKQVDGYTYSCIYVFELKKNNIQLQEFTMNKASDLEKERCALLVRCTTAEQHVEQLQEYVKVLLKK
jgi:hypothetical protein